MLLYDLILNIQDFNKKDFINLYHTIIQHRRKNVLIHKDGKIETHHIIPKSLCKNKIWKDLSYNIVNLYCYEHFICHYILWKIYPCKQTSLALWNMSNLKTKFRYEETNLDQISLWKLSQDFQKLRENCCLYGEKNGNFGHKWNQEQRDRMSKQRKGKFFGDDKTREKMSIRMSGQNNNGSTKNMSKEKRLEKRRKGIETLFKNREKITCPFCGTEGIGYAGKPSVNMRRYHFDNCLKNPNLTDEQRSILVEKRNEDSKKLSIAKKGKKPTQKQLDSLAKLRAKRQELIKQRKDLL